jgi:hypothetical protein
LRACSVKSSQAGGATNACGKCGIRWSGLTVGEVAAPPPPPTPRRKQDTQQDNSPGKQDTQRVCHLSGEVSCL